MRADPLRQPIRRLTPAEFDTRLAAGDRRAGTLLYNQACAGCAACEALRVDVRAFAPSRSQRRAQAKGDAAVTVQLGPIEVDDARIALYGAHERGRGLDLGLAIRENHSMAYKLAFMPHERRDLRPLSSPSS